MKRALPLAALVLCLVACKKDRSGDLVGTWTGANGTSMTFDKEGKVNGQFAMGQMGSAPITGKWTLDGSTVALTLETISGQPMAQIKKQIDQIKSLLTKATPAQREALDNIDKPHNLTLSEDGKTLSGTGNNHLSLTKQSS